MLARLPRTATFRLAFVYAAVFALAALSLIGFFDWTVTSYARRSIDAQLTDEMQVLQDAAKREGPGEALELIRQKQAALGDRQYLYLLTGADGRALAGRLPLSTARPGWGRWTRPAPAASREFNGETEEVRTLGQRTPGGGVVVVGLSTYAYHELRELLLLASAISAVVVTLLALAIAWLIGRQFLTRVERVNLAAARIIGGRIDERLPTVGMGEEFDRLAVNLNGMLERIEALMESLRQVSSNIAHDLRTPLSRLRRRLESALLAEGDNAERDALAHEAITQVDEILVTFNALLRIGQLEGGAAREAFRPVDLSELLERVRQAYEPVAEDLGQGFAAEITPGLVISGDEELLSQMLSNLIDNAMTHAPEPGDIALTLTRVGSSVVLAVADHGPGIPEAERDKVLQRFYRLDASRSTPGAGLGLSMASAIAHLHRANLSLGDNGPGLRVEIAFPAPAALDIENL